MRCLDDGLMVTLVSARVCPLPPRLRGVVPCCSLRGETVRLQEIFAQTRVCVCVRACVCAYVCVRVSRDFSCSCKYFYAETLLPTRGQ